MDASEGKLKLDHSVVDHLAGHVVRALLLGCLAAAAHSQTISITGTINSALAPFDQLMTSLMQRYGIPGGQLAVTQNGRLVLAHGYGSADSSSNVQPDSLFRIASLSKQLTSVAVLQLVQQGKLSLDDHPFTLLSDIPPLPGAVPDSRLAQTTVRNLLQHSGGWDRDSTQYDPMFDSLHIASVVGVASPPSTRDIIRYMLGRSLDFTPGTRYVYSNFGYAVLGRVIEKLTGVAYSQYVLANVLAPVGVSDMRIGQTLIGGRQPGEVSYYMEPGSTPGQSVYVSSPANVPRPYGSFYLEAMDSHGAWLASAIDLLKFWNGIDGRRAKPLLTPATVQQLTAQPSIPDWVNSPYWYGLGFTIRPTGNDANWWHGGLLDGTMSWAVRTYNGYAWVALFNQRMNDSTVYSRFVTDLDNGLWNAYAAVSNWPTTDLFSSYLSNSNPDPALASLSPSGASAGGPAFSLSVTGSAFVAGSTVQWNGVTRPTTFVSSTQLTAAIPAADIAALGSAKITVNSPLPGGGTSTSLAFPVTAPLPTLTAASLANGATYFSGGLVPGSWAQVKGANLGKSTRTWDGSDFAGLGNNLPTSLDGVQVKVNSTLAAVYFISPTQVSFQVPSGISGTASVQVIYNGVASNTVTATAAVSSPGIFPIIVNGTSYPAGVFLDGKYVGDSAIGPSFRAAKPGDIIELFATGLVATPAGVLPKQQTVSGVTVTIGNVTVPADFAGLVAVGEFQINFTLPQEFATRASAAYPISIQANGVSSPLTINSSPPGQLLLPIVANAVAAHVPMPE